MSASYRTSGARESGWAPAQVPGDDVVTETPLPEYLDQLSRAASGMVNANLTEMHREMNASFKSLRSDIASLRSKLTDIRREIDLGFVRFSDIGVASPYAEFPGSEKLRPSAG